MGGTITSEEFKKQLRASEANKEYVRYLEIGVQIGKDEARKELHKLLNQYEFDERRTPSHKMLCDRMIQELREHIQAWEINAVPWEQAKQELEQDADQLSAGSS